jgi:hypothetical protein
MHRLPVPPPLRAGDSCGAQEDAPRRPSDPPRQLSPASQKSWTPAGCLNFRIPRRAVGLRPTTRRSNRTRTDGQRNAAASAAACRGVSSQAGGAKAPGARRLRWNALRLVGAAQCTATADTQPATATHQLMVCPRLAARDTGARGRTQCPPGGPGPPRSPCPACTPIRARRKSRGGRGYALATLLASVVAGLLFLYVLYLRDELAHYHTEGNRVRRVAGGGLARHRSGTGLSHGLQSGSRALRPTPGASALLRLRRPWRRT